jgi:hypothetical protein
MAEDEIEICGVQPRSVRIVENYSYSQEVSSNPRLEPAGRPSGEIEVTVPYDGYAFFSRQACEDVDAEVANGSLSGELSADIGRLEVSNYDRTDLSETLPLKIPILGSGIPSTEELRGDQYLCRMIQAYQPNYPEVNPVEVFIELLDEDILGRPTADYFTSRWARRAEDAVAEITQQVSFKRCLLLVTVVKLRIPEEVVVAPMSATVSRVSLNWPTLTHFRTLRLFLNELDTRRERLVSYNQLAQSVEWFDVPITESKDSSPAGLKTYLSNPMFLLIDQPGELYTENILKGDIDVCLKGSLLSGVGVRVEPRWEQGKENGNEPKASQWPSVVPKNSERRRPLNGPRPDGHEKGSLPIAPPASFGRETGHATDQTERVGRNQEDKDNVGTPMSSEHTRGPGSTPVEPELTTRLTSTIALVLDDAFEGRRRAPFQQLHFDEVIPDPMRLADIKIALFDRGFQVDEFPLSRDQEQLRHLIVAERPEGHDSMKLWIFVDGKKYTTQRRTEVPGGQVYTSTFESGDIRVYLRGEMAGDSQCLIEEMNTVQLALRDRFERLRARR